ncbi:G-protein coupled receptor [Colletotrichum scovillei]|uniref:G-protein coupled receptor n=2 Tax=Colletotrichum acutatum species complex TaxID=2707335 RepID=A0A9P7UH56_9PEZI|nr:G-protein coupled receptor [Colletotrichum scovillei]KXH46999.1 G-protein coupled receptor [Colletotrichum simmondsii]KAF4785558.1 G-protein coupled receptor [Colletotrichum scovillei]KAG7055586.1 G-protein coupled receptor [Colletotrichum scovillei]KAG7075062.1 G-protein coupled receptor [Colletotrichum scovillei]KAG7082361.1 G-protein coupled receptor [Colletotrichum scovillei]
MDTPQEKANLDKGDLDLLSIIERTCSVFSLLGCVFIIVTFCSSRAFHKPINRLVFFASFGNMMTNVGTLMARSYIGSPDSPGCQLQAFLVQMFMPADAFWTLTMAINVYLTFYYKFDAERLRRMEIPYLVCCYGIPFIPALVYVFVRNGDGLRVYGNATLWCWIRPEWEIWRILTFYGPVWIAILITFFIYIRAGREIYQKRKQLHNFSSSDHDQMNSFHDVLTSMKTTEVYVTSEAMDQPQGSIGLATVGRRGSEAGPVPRLPNAAYSVSISANRYSRNESQAEAAVPPAESNTADTSAQRPMNSARRRNYELNNAAWSYTKCSILFFTVILITWVPSSANRVYSVIHTKESSTPLEFMSAFVLPLQGFWNALIYVVTSWKACKTLWTDIKYSSRRPDVTEIVGSFRHSDQFKIPSQNRRTKNYESESITELTNSRPASNEQASRS